MAFKAKKNIIIRVLLILLLLLMILQYDTYNNQLQQLLQTYNIKNNTTLNYIYIEENLFNLYNGSYQLYYKDKNSHTWKYLANFKDQKPNIKEVYKSSEYIVYQETNSERLFIDYNNKNDMIDLTNEVVNSLKKGDIDVFQNNLIGDAEDFFMNFKPKDTSTYYGKRIEIIRIYYGDGL